MIEWTRISHGFAVEDVLCDVTLCLEPGRVLALLGPSGCGKSTLMKIAAGLVTPRSGVMTNTFARTACVFQDPRLLPWRRARENISFSLRIMGEKDRKAKMMAEEIGHRMGLSREDLKKFPYELSGGMRQRVALARALVIAPDLLLLDEPFSALDHRLRRDMQDLLIQALEAGGLSALFITHDVLEALRLADEVAIIGGQPGRIMSHVTVSEARQNRSPAMLYDRAAALTAEPAVKAAFEMRTDL